MKILLVAFACTPGRGSEHGLGWNWACTAASLGHDVLVITQTEPLEAIAEQTGYGELPAELAFHFFMPPWLERIRKYGSSTRFRALTLHLVHLTWQLLLYRYAKNRLNLDGFDVVHHLTFSGIRHPSVMNLLPIPLALGPLGGGERAPYALRRSLPLRSWLRDAARDAHAYALRFDPITRGACRDALVVYAKTAETARMLPFASSVQVRLEIGAQPKSRSLRVDRLHDGLRLLYAGRFLPLKGMHLGLRAVAEARAQGLNVMLTMVGTGPAEAAWRKLAGALSLDECVKWVEWVPHEEMDAVYAAHDALLFPSLHDSSGNVVLEALCEGLPVICFDLGGPAVLVDETCGRVVKTNSLNERECVNQLSRALLDIGHSPTLLADLARGAYVRGGQYTWENVVGGLYQDLEKRLSEKAKAAEAKPRKLTDR